MNKQKIWIAGCRACGRQLLVVDGELVEVDGLPRHVDTSVDCPNNPDNRQHPQAEVQP